MEKQLRQLCEKHGLTCLSLMVYPGRVNVFPHWDDEYGNDRCVSAHGRTFEDAFDMALRQIEALKVAA